MTKRKITGLISVLVLSALLACGCKKQVQETETEPPQSMTQAETETESETETEAETEEVLPEGKMRSYLTGEIIDEAVGQKRPFAVMINNVQEALPQSGISQAGILYEAVVEADITRLMAVFQTSDGLEKVGPVRSCRHYYLDFAHDEEAVYAHFGWSIYAEDRIKKEGIKTLNLMYGGINSVYYRSSDRVAPHNVYVTGDMLQNGLKAFGADDTMPDSYTGRFNYYTKDTDLENGQAANKVAISFTSKSELEYDAQEKNYKKFQYGDKHIDDVTGEQLAFKNIIIQYAPYTCIDTNADCQDIALTGTGKGMYITNGKAVNITWKKDDLQNDHTHYYLEDGSELQINTGKTYIAVIPTDYTVTLSE